MPAQRGRAVDQDQRGRRRELVKAAVFSFAVELDVFGKGKLCEDGVEMMIR